MLLWTKDTPSASGWYWVRDWRGCGEEEIAFVSLGEAENVVAIHHPYGIRRQCALEDLLPWSEWQGPIVPAEAA